jgi:hypothetical protein
MIVIDGKEYNGSGQIEGNHLSVIFLGDMADAFAWDKTMQVNIDGAEHTVTALRSIGRYDDQVRCEWDIASEAVELASQLAAAQATINENNSRIEKIRQAIRNIGLIPTLSELKAFLTAVKEAIHYDD